jgi:long-chain acyl-CoA synthetase
MDSDVVCLPDLVRASSLMYPNRTALQDATASIVVTYGELWSRVERGAAALSERGLTAGDRVLVTLPPDTDWMPVVLAILHARLVAVPIPADTPADRTRLAAMFAGVGAWIGQPDDAERQVALSHVPHIRPRDLLTDATIATHTIEEADPNATAVLVFTSGSTSRPRAVALSHRNILANVRALLTSRQPVPDEAVLSTLPPSHAYELVAGQLAPLAAGARIVYAGVPLPNRVIDAMRTQRITRAALVPALFNALAREVIDDLVASGAADPACRHLSVDQLAARVRLLSGDGRARLGDAIRERIGTAFHAVVIGGAASHPAWGEILTAVGIYLDVGYGLTEAGPVVAMGRAGECPAGSVGRPLPDVRVRIGHDDEVLVWSESIMQGYAGDREGTDASLEHGWLRTGDRGRVDADGFLFITGRIKEAMVTSAGETIYPDEVEPYFASPLFAEIAVVPAPGDEGNDRPTLVVVPADPAAPVAALTNVALSLNAEAPPRLRVTDVIVRSDPLPRTALGKIRRRVMADALSVGKAAS